MTVIKFPTTPTTIIGTIVRFPRPEAKFWKVIRIENGKAVAKPAGFGPKKGAC